MVSNLDRQRRALASAGLASALAPVAAELEALRPQLVARLPLAAASARAMADHIFAAQGKMVRPALFLLACRLLAYKGEHLESVAVVCEYVHTASLLHDDVIDNSPLRRNRPTSNRIWGDAAAVLMGDVIYATASELMAKTGHHGIVQGFAEAIRQMSEAELLQLEYLYDHAIDEGTYFRILAGKTASLMAAASGAAATLAGAPASQQQALTGMGHKLGMAFQLLDDALDFTGTTAQLGKAAYADLREGKITLPLILLRSRLPASEQAQFAEILTATSLSSAHSRKIQTWVARHATVTDTLEKARQFSEEALDLLTRNFLATPERDHLAALIVTLQERCV